MRSNLRPWIITISVVLALATSSAVTAQLDDDPDFDPYQNLETALVLNANTDAAVNAAIESAAGAAHGEVRVARKKDGPGFVTMTRPDRTSVVLKAQDYADEEKNLIIIHGGDSDLTAGFVQRSEFSTIVDLGQPLPCLDSGGRFDRTGECAGGAELLPANYSVVTFEVQDPAYLAGVLAASASRNDRLGIISGMADCDECNRYIQGFILGAQSVAPEIAIEVAYLADEDESLAFGDPVVARTFAEAFIDVYQPDVLLPIANESSFSMIEAACDADILAVGTDVDVSRDHPELAECILTSITRDVEKAVRHSIYEFSTTPSALPRLREASLADGFVGLTDEWRTKTLPVGVTDLYDDALNGLITEAIDACPSACGEPYGPDGSVVADPGSGDADATVTELGAEASEAPAGG